jgi:hypothetical protein
MSEYPAIPGLGNLGIALSYNSSWHILNAFFGFSFLGFQHFNDLNGYLYSLLIFYSIDGIEGLRKRQQIVLNFTKVAFIAFSYFFLRPFIVSASVDFAAGMLTWLVMMELLAQAQRHSSDNSNIYALVGLSCFAFTAKISAIWILAVCIVYVFKLWYQSSKLILFKVIVFMLLLTSPYFARNVITSGYLFNPITIIDVFEVDWKVPKETHISGMLGLQYIIEPYLTGITHQNKFVMNEQNVMVQTDERLSFEEWIASLIDNRTFYNTLLIMFIGLAFFVYLGVAIAGWQKLLKSNVETILFISLLFGGVFWGLFLLPSWKFGGIRIALGAFMLFSTLSLGFIFKTIYTKIGQLAFFMLVFLASLLPVKNIFNVEENSDSFKNHLLLPPKYPLPPTKSEKLGEITVQIPLNSGGSYKGCWGAKLPCIDNLKATLEPRGKSILTGFRSKFKKVYK